MADTGVVVGDGWLVVVVELGGGGMTLFTLSTNEEKEVK